MKQQASVLNFRDFIGMTRNLKLAKETPPQPHEAETVG